MQYIRWYDKTPDLSEILEFIRGLDEPIQNQIAQDILQILINEFKIDIDEQNQEMNKTASCPYKRWYDGNVDFFTSMQIIKNLPDVIKNEVVKKIVESVMLVYLEGLKDA